MRRNSGRGDARWDVGGRLSWTFGFGARREGANGPGGTPQIVIRTIGGPAPDSMGGFSGGADSKRWRFELFLAGTNLLNHYNPLAYSGVMTSVFFGQATSAMPGTAPRAGLAVLLLDLAVRGSQFAVRGSRSTRCLNSVA